MFGAIGEELSAVWFLFYFLLIETIWDNLISIKVKREIASNLTNARFTFRYRQMEKKASESAKSETEHSGVNNHEGYLFLHQRARGEKERSLVVIDIDEACLAHEKKGNHYRLFLITIFHFESNFSLSESHDFIELSCSSLFLTSSFLLSTRKHHLSPPKSSE